jgi:hypothetical protein
MIGYGTRYQFEFDGTCKPFATLLTTKCKVLILKKGYSGAITTIPYGQATPVEIDYPTADDDIFYPIRGSILSFKVLGGIINMDSIISEDEKEYVLEYYRDGNLFWTGFVSPELCEEDIFLKYPAIEFRTIDGLSAFKNAVLKETNGRLLYGFNSFKNIIASALRFIGYNYNFNILLKLKNKNELPIDRIIDIIGTYTNVFREKGNQAFGVDVIIKSICYLFNVVIYQNRGQWFIIKPKDLAFGLYTTDKYNNDGAYTGTDTIKQYNHGTDFLIIAEPKRKIRRFYKQAQIDYKYYNGDSVFNSNFNIFTKDLTGVWTYAKYQTDGVGSNSSLTVLDTASGTPPYPFSWTSFVKGGEVYPCLNNATNQWGVSFNNTGAFIETSVYLGADETFSYTLSVLSYVGFEVRLQSNLYSTVYLVNGNWTANQPSIFKTDTTSETNVSVPFEGTVTFKMYAFPAFVGLYNQIVTYFNVESTYGENTILPYALESTIATNPKDTSINPSTIEVFNGSYILKQDGTNTITDESNITTDGFNISEIYYERAEEYGYKIQELAVRNVLNQYSDYRNIFSGTIIGKDLEYGAIYNFPVQGALANKKFFPLSMKFNERDCTADVIFMELTPNEIEPGINCTLFDTDSNIVYQELSSSKKKIVMG